MFGKKKSHTEFAQLQAELEQREAILKEWELTLEQRSRELEAENDRLQREQKERLKAEAEDVRRKLQEEQEELRIRTQGELQKRVQTFSDSYSSYLSQVKLVMDALTEAAISTGEVFLIQEETDTEALFRAKMEDSLEREREG